MSQNPKAGMAIEAFNRLVEDVSRETKETMIVVNDDTMMGCSSGIFLYSSEEIKKIIDDAGQKIEAIFASHVALLAEGGDGEKNTFSEAVIESLNGEKYVGNPYDYDMEECAIDTLLKNIIKAIPDFVKGLDI